MKKKVNPLVPAAVVLVVLCAAYGRQMRLQGRQKTARFM